MSKIPDDPSETPDELSPEWTEYETRWAVSVSDFGGMDEAALFLLRRKTIFLEAQALGISKDLLTPFKPNKPGFEDRIRDGLGHLAKVAGMAAE